MDNNTKQQIANGVVKSLRRRYNEWVRWLNAVEAVRGTGERPQGRVPSKVGKVRMYGEANHLQRLLDIEVPSEARHTLEEIRLTLVAAGATKVAPVPAMAR